MSKTYKDTLCNRCNTLLRPDNWNTSKIDRGEAHCKGCSNKPYKSTPSFNIYSDYDISEWKKENYRRSAFRLLKQSAKRKRIEFTVTLNDFSIPEYCPILGIELYPGNNIDKDNSPSVDRLDPAKGYTPSNITVISYRANRIKNDASFAELNLIATWLSKRINEN